ncbi:MAG TPA: hypothetical protein VMU15_05655 [Anaeromyxobacter sp.]|nr:hypothetical protein [Anaeromyxobacter sp.]
MLALSLAVSAAGDPRAASEPEREPAQAPIEAPEAIPTSAPLPLGGWRQDLALGLHSTTFWSHAGNQYTFHSLSLGYMNSWGRNGPFLHTTGLLPLQGREDGRVYALGPYYRLRYGGDVLTGYQWRWRAWESVEAEAGAGLHVLFIVLKGITGYRDFSASPLGLGTDMALRWRTGRSLGTWPVTVGLYGSTALDVYDPIHGNDLRHGFTFQAGAQLGLNPRGKP